MAELVELEIESLAAGGDGVARLDGMAVFVPRAAPGDRVLARITESRRRFARAEIEQVLRPGPDRRDPPCRYAGRCGGCSWQHLDESAQRRAREQILRDALQRIGGLRELPDIVHLESPRVLGYRSRARVAHAAGQVGFRAHASHRVVDVNECIVLDPATSAELARLRARRRRGHGETEIRGFGPQVRVAGRDYLVGPDSFFQANASLWSDWLDLIARKCGSGALAIELYAGVGFYTAVIERGFEHVIAVERARSVHDLERNTGVEVIHASAESWAKESLPGMRPDLVLLNPPRMGCAPEVSEAIALSGARRVVYVSCDPSTLARDLVRIGDGHRVDEIVLIDALPQTHHLEVLVVLNAVS